MESALVHPTCYITYDGEIFEVPITVSRWIAPQELNLAIREAVSAHALSGKIFLCAERIVWTLSHGEAVVKPLSDLEVSVDLGGEIPGTIKGIIPVFEALRLSVRKLNTWDERVVKDNGVLSDMAVEDAPANPRLTELTERLSFPPLLQGWPEGTVAQESVNSYFRNHPSVRNCFALDETEDHGAPIKLEKGFDYFVNDCAGIAKGAQDLLRIKISSSQTSTFFFDNFVRNIFWRFTEAQDQSAERIYLDDQNLLEEQQEKLLVYREGDGWDIYLLPAEEGKDIHKYSPKSDFSLFYKWSGCPCLIGEVVSQKKKEGDRYRMLAQAIAAARVGRVLTGSADFILMAVYVSAKLVATRYLLQVDPHEETRVDIRTAVYDLTNEIDVAGLRNELFNWRTYALEHIAPMFAQGDERLKKTKERVSSLKSIGS